MSEEYDYIVCGAGTAGCTVAGRLARNGKLSILVVEAGSAAADVPASRIPAAVSQVLGTSADWNIWSEPNPDLNNRQLHLGRGKFVGGSSGANGTLCIRGTRQDYDDWDVDGWSGEEVFGYMAKAENFSGEAWFRSDRASHGSKGPIKTEVHQPASISSRVLQSFESKGLSRIDDLFTTGEAASGCGHTVRTIRHGIRSTAADYLSGHPEITVRTGVHVDRVRLEQRPTAPDEWIATGIELIDQEGTRTAITARKEVILAAGAFGSPAILLRSGIGAKDEIQRHGIQPRVECPGVGQNLVDHMVLLNFYEVTEPHLTHDQYIWHKGGKDRSMAQYKNDSTGFFSQFPFGTFAWARLDGRLTGDEEKEPRATPPERDGLGLRRNQPHVEYWNTECYSPKYMFKDFPADHQNVFALAIMPFGPKSRGTVQLKSANPLDLPVVDHRHLSDPLDLRVFAEACAFGNEMVMEGQGTKDIVGGSWPRSQRHHAHTTRKEWEDTIRERADTCYHPAGSCKMGRSEDPMAVVDAQLRVRGVAHLRVADASIMPTLPSGHPQMVCYAIGEKLAELLTAE